MLVSQQSRYAWLGWSGGVALLDLHRAELLDEVKIHQRGRLSLWNEDGALATWPLAFMGNPCASIIPIGNKPAKAVAAAASNMRAKLTDALDVHVSLAK